MGAKVPKIRKLNTSGFTLVEAMITAGVGMTILFGLATMMNNVGKSVVGNRTLASRDQLSSLLGRYAGDPFALQASMNYSGGGSIPFPTNASLNSGMLGKCVNGGTPNGCDASQAWGLTLTDPNGNPMSGATGTEGVYDSNGTLCGNASNFTPTKQCPILAETVFKPQCQNGASSCDKAQSITVTYTLKQASNLTSGTNGFGALKVVSHSVSTSTDAIIAAASAAPATGITNSLAKWTSSASIGNSAVYEVGGNVGIGINNPQMQLDVNGGVKVGAVADSGCNASTLGTLRYVSGPGKKIEACVQPSSGPPGWVAVGGGGGGPSNVQYHRTSQNVSGYYLLTIPCGAGETLIGGGAYCTNGGVGDIYLVKSRPTDANDGWLVACDGSAAGAGYTVEGYAICMGP